MGCLLELYPAGAPSHGGGGGGGGGAMTAVAVVDLDLTGLDSASLSLGSNALTKGGAAFATVVYGRSSNPGGTASAGASGITITGDPAATGGVSYVELDWSALVTGWDEAWLETGYGVIVELVGTVGGHTSTSDNIAMEVGQLLGTGDGLRLYYASSTTNSLWARRDSSDALVAASTPLQAGDEIAVKVLLLGGQVGYAVHAVGSSPAVDLDAPTSGLQKTGASYSATSTRRYGASGAAVVATAATGRRGIMTWTALRVYRLEVA